MSDYYYYIFIKFLAYSGLLVGAYEYWKGTKEPMEFEEKTIKIEI